jgi:EAL domain-containing protein (putative c-di-GMP-specific phosphodiesterase class I)
LTVPAIPEARISEDLHGAGHRGELVAYFQAQISLPQRAVVGVEALARWIHPEFGLLSPMHFIPAAETTGLIGDLGRHMLELSVSQVAAWRKSGIELDLAVNVSPSQLAAFDYCDDIADVLDRSGLPPTTLTLEITESQPIADLAAVVECLLHVRELGVGVSIDDFGAGHSSLEQFRRLPATELKLDQSIIQGSVDHAATRLSDALDEAHQRGLRIVAEGVETHEQLALAERLGCHRAQGYLIGTPMSADDFVRWLG